MILCSRFLLSRRGLGLLLLSGALGFGCADDVAMPDECSIKQTKALGRTAELNEATDNEDFAGACALAGELYEMTRCCAQLDEPSPCVLNETLAMYVELLPDCELP